jgi:hypothetical protein
VREIWQGRALQAASKYGEVAQSTAVCCNACRTCVTTNLAGLALGALTAAAVGVSRFARRFARAA